VAICVIWNGKKLGEDSYFKLGLDDGDFKFKVVGRIPANIVKEIV